MFPGTFFFTKQFGELLFLLDFEGQVTGTALKDWGGHNLTVTQNGSIFDPGISTFNAKFGVNSLFNSASGITFPCPVTIGIGDFQCDWWSYCANSSVAHPRIMFEYSDGTFSIQLRAPGGVIHPYLQGIDQGASSAVQTDFVQYHNCIQRKDQVLRYFMNGVLIFNFGNAFPFNGGTFAFMGDTLGTTSVSFNGYMDELRGITNTPDFFPITGFTPPSAPYARP